MKKYEKQNKNTQNYKKKNKIKQMRNAKSKSTNPGYCTIFFYVLYI